MIGTVCIGVGARSRVVIFKTGGYVSAMISCDR